MQKANVGYKYASGIFVPDPPSRVIAVAHEKGGVGKTTTTVTLVIGLARQGNKVLLPDADPQGDLSKCLGIASPQSLTNTLSAAMNSVITETPMDPASVIQKHREGVDFMPANASLATTEITLVNAMNREYVLQEFLSSIQDHGYSHILIDCRPSLGLTVVNALTAAADDMDELFKTVGRIKQRPNPHLKNDDGGRQDKSCPTDYPQCAAEIWSGCACVRDGNPLRRPFPLRGKVYSSMTRMERRRKPTNN
jgi:hypothetical protein